MITCKICGTVKPETEFYIFQNKGKEPKRRKRCKSCISKREANRYYKKKYGISHKKEKKVAVIVSNEPTEVFKICTGCGLGHPIDNFYKIGKLKNQLTARCKECYNTYKKTKPEDSLEYKTEPGEWTSDEQKFMVFDLLRRIGWKYNLENNIWYKQGLKDVNGKFLNLKKKKARNKKIVFDYQEFLDYRRRGFSLTDIALRMDMSHAALCKKIKTERDKILIKDGDKK